MLIPLCLISCNEPDPPEIVLQNTANKIESIRPTGQLQVLTALLEDFDHEEISQGLFSKSCIQILRERCSYSINMENIKYTPHLGSSQVTVEIEEPQATCTVQDSPFLSDDEDFWAKHLTNSQLNKLKAAIHLKNLQKFTTPENQIKAKKYGEDFINRLISNLGLTAQITWVKSK